MAGASRNRERSPLQGHFAKKEAGGGIDEASVHAVLEENALSEED